MNNDSMPSPIPLEECPWCGTKFKAISFRLIPNQDEPQDLRISCVKRECEFSRGVNLPIVAVDEPIYRRLPCFIIATVDKFAALPWTGPVGAFFGRMQRYDERASTARATPCAEISFPANDCTRQTLSFRANCTSYRVRWAPWLGPTKAHLTDFVQ